MSGYELQPGKRTVRGELEKALQKIYKRKIGVISASRTDSGVHALDLVVNYKTAQRIPVSRIPAAMNSVLSDDIRVLNAEEKRSAFNSRFDARSKEYEYLIFNGAIMPPSVRNYVWHVKPKLDLRSMRKATKNLVGKHDFSSFCAAGGDDKDFVRIIHSFGIRHSALGIWDNQKVKIIRIKVKGNGFLYKMVRNMVGTLVDVGLGKIGPSDVKRILLAKDRKLAGRTAPPQGLCLIKVNFK